MKLRSSRRVVGRESLLFRVAQAVGLVGRSVEGSACRAALRDDEMRWFATTTTTNYDVFHSSNRQMPEQLVAVRLRLGSCAS